LATPGKCLAHVYLRRVLASAELFGVRLEEIGREEIGREEIDCGLW